MVAIEHVLLVNTGLSSVALLVLLFLSNKKGSKKITSKKSLNSDLQKIKEQIVDE